MFDYIRRMCLEYESLRVSMERLAKYIDLNCSSNSSSISNEYNVLCCDQLKYDVLCCDQLEIMQQYLKVLERRIFLQVLKGVSENEKIYI